MMYMTDMTHNLWIIDLQDFYDSNGYGEVAESKSDLEKVSEQ